MAYLALADSLARELDGLEAGERLASEHELVARHGVSRITARAALRELEDRNLVRRIRGAGTFKALGIDYPISVRMAPSFSETIRRRGHRPGYELRSVRTRPAPTAVGEILGLAAGGRAIRVERLGLVDDVVASRQVTWVPVDVGGDLRAELAGTGSLYGALVHRGFEPERAWARAGMATLPRPVAEILGHEGRPQGWFLESCNRCRLGGRVIELSRSWLRADVFRVRFELGTDRDGVPPLETAMTEAG